MAVAPNFGAIPGTVPGNASGPGANLAGAQASLPAFQPVPSSASYNAMYSSLQGQPTLSGFLPSAGIGAGNGGLGAVATPGGGSTGAPALPSTTPGVIAGNHPGTMGPRFAGSSTNTNYEGATPTTQPAGGGLRFPGTPPAGLPNMQGGLQGLFAQWLGQFNGQGGPQQPANPTTVPPAQTPSATPPQSPWGQWAQWFRNPTGTPVGQS